jgi:hypothetical protein
LQSVEKIRKLQGKGELPAVYRTVVFETFKAAAKDNAKEAVKTDHKNSD